MLYQMHAQENITNSVCGITLRGISRYTRCGLYATVSLSH